MKKPKTRTISIVFLEDPGSTDTLRDLVFQHKPMTDKQFRTALRKAVTTFYRHHSEIGGPTWETLDLLEAKHFRAHGLNVLWSGNSEDKIIFPWVNVDADTKL